MWNSRSAGTLFTLSCEGPASVLAAKMAALPIENHLRASGEIQRSLERTLLRINLFFCSCKTAYSTASGRGGHPGT